MNSSLIDEMGTQAQGISELFAMRKCIGCEARMLRGESFVCAYCQAHLPFTYEELTPYDNPTARLLWGKCHVERAVAGLLNHSHSNVARMIYHLKYRGNTELGEWLGTLLAKRLCPHGFFDDIDIVMPLPLHPRRERARGYNQSLAFAEGLVDVTHIPIETRAVARVRDTPSQATLTPDKRSDNMVDAFRVVNPLLVAGKHILLVDDIITSGGSLASCIGEINKENEAHVSVLTIGRTVI